MVDEYTPLTPVQRFIAGACAGATATCLTYPLDFLRTRMAVKEGHATYRNIVIAFRTIGAQEVKHECIALCAGLPYLLHRIERSVIWHFTLFWYFMDGV